MPIVCYHHHSTSVTIRDLLTSVAYLAQLKCRLIMFIPQTKQPSQAFVPTSHRPSLHILHQVLDSSNTQDKATTFIRDDSKLLLPFLLLILLVTFFPPTSVFPSLPTSTSSKELL